MQTETFGVHVTPNRQARIKRDRRKAEAARRRASARTAARARKRQAFA